MIGFQRGPRGFQLGFQQLPKRRFGGWVEYVKRTKHLARPNAQEDEVEAVASAIIAKFIEKRAGTPPAPKGTAKKRRQVTALPTLFSVETPTVAPTAKYTPPAVRPKRQVKVPETEVLSARSTNELAYLLLLS